MNISGIRAAGVGALRTTELSNQVNWFFPKTNYLNPELIRLTKPVYG